MDGEARAAGGPRWPHASPSAIAPAGAERYAARSTDLLRMLVALPISENSIIIGSMATAGPAAHMQVVGRDHAFHPLRVARVVGETADASSFVLDVPPELEQAFVYRAG